VKESPQHLEKNQTSVRITYSYPEGGWTRGCHMKYRAVAWRLKEMWEGKGGDKWKWENTYRVPEHEMTRSG